MKSLFKNLSIEDFDKRFADEDACYKYLAEEKWKDGYVCKKCENTNYCKGKSPYSRRCTRCKSAESATSHTVFHACKISLKEAFKISYMVCSSPEISSYELSRQLDKRQMTCWKFKKKIMECLKNKSDFMKIGE